MNAALADKLNAATLADAQAWFATPEKFTFCIDYLEIYARARYSDRWVDQLETIFEGLLAEEAADAKFGPTP